MSNVVEQVKEQASSVVGIEHEPTNIRETMAALASSAQSSASSFAHALPTIRTPHTDSNVRQGAQFVVNEAQYRAAEAYARASQGGLRAVGIEPSPTDLAQSATSIAHAAQSSAPRVFHNVCGGPKERVGEFFGDVSQAAVRAVGGEPEPTNLQQSATSLVNIVSRALSTATSVATSLAQPHSDYSKSASSVVSAVGGVGIKASSTLSLVRHLPLFTTLRGRLLKDSEELHPLWSWPQQIRSTTSPLPTLPTASRQLQPRSGVSSRRPAVQSRARRLR